MSFIQLPANAGVREEELGVPTSAPIRSYVVSYDIAGHDNYWLVRTASAADALAHVQHSMSRCGAVGTRLRVAAVYDY